MISGGENIQPEPIESLLLGIAGIRRAVVVPRADTGFGERPVAFVAGKFDPEDLKNRLAAKLEGFAVPDAFLPWPKDIPEDVPKPDFALFKRLAAGL
jgi:O-succinylbenzoic acid--CoA ligase